MNPAFSVIVFTTVAGAAQGLVGGLAFAVLAGVELGPTLPGRALLVAAAMLVVGLGASFLHLGRPERAWRAVMMWRTSWLSREVIVLPAFIGVVLLWWLAPYTTLPSYFSTVVLPLAAIALAALLWYCTAMIYSCLRFIQEWAHPLTLVNFVLIGLSSGLLLAAALAASAGVEVMVRIAGPAALAATLLGWLMRTLALRRNTAIRHRSTLQSATGIQAPVLVQKSMGMSAGSFNTREFFHSASAAGVKLIRFALFGLGFALPSLLAGGAIAGQIPWLWWCAVVVQAPGLMADRWFFFAQAKHPQNLYYQVVS